MTVGKVALLSLEPWDDVWRRNQHLAARLVRSHIIDSLLFVTPPAGGFALRAQRFEPMPRVQVVTPPLVVPRRYGGHRVLAQWLRRTVAGIDLLWINDPVAGVDAHEPTIPALYDVTDDWRELEQSVDKTKIIAAEDVLVRQAHTVVCSTVLAERWEQRYGLAPDVVQNGVDVAAIRSAVPVQLAGPAPHAVYVGTLHRSRLDVDLLLELAIASPGTVHLVGPNHLEVADFDTLREAGIAFHGPVPSPEVPRWLVAAHILICPHIVNPFTLSLDAIKSHEYLATDRPVVATASSGFQALKADGLRVVGRADFVSAVVGLAGTERYARQAAVDWDVRAAEFAGTLQRLSRPSQ